MMPGTWDRFDIVAAYYWWLSDHYDGMGSKNYRRLCKLSKVYRPGMSERSPGPNPEGYDALCERAGCTHPRLCETCGQQHVDGDGWEDDRELSDLDDDERKTKGWS